MLTQLCPPRSAELWSCSPGPQITSYKSCLSFCLSAATRSRMIGIAISAPQSMCYWRVAKGSSCCRQSGAHDCSIRNIRPHSYSPQAMSYGKTRVADLYHRSAQSRQEQPWPTKGTGCGTGERAEVAGYLWRLRLIKLICDLDKIKRPRQP